MNVVTKLLILACAVMGFLVFETLNVSAVEKDIPGYNNVDNERSSCVQNGNCGIPVCTPENLADCNPPKQVDECDPSTSNQQSRCYDKPLIKEAPISEAPAEGRSLK